jgi:hypothetical protein
VTDPYTAFGEQLLDVAMRQTATARSANRHGWRDRRLRVAIIALVLLLMGATIALATSEWLSGSPVQRDGPLNPDVGYGIPAPGGSRLLSLRAQDPQGGPPWGMRIVHTTRGEICVQIGRVLHGQLGELGTNGAFKDDGRFHPLAPDVLPIEGPSSTDTVCALSGQTFTAILAGIPTSAASMPPGPALPLNSRRDVSFGVLGPHALGITYYGPPETNSQAFSAGIGAYLLVRRARKPQQGEPGFSSAYGDPGRRHPSPIGAVSAITYRFGDLVCSESRGARLAKPCPKPTPAPATTIAPTRNLDRPLHITLQAHHDSTYDAEVEFTAPYTVASAHQLYEIIEPAPPHCGLRFDRGLPLERDVKQGDKVKANLMLIFQNSGRCGSMQTVQVRYVNPEGPSASYPHESVIVGATTVTEPTGAG